MHILQIYKDYYPVLGGIENSLRLLSEGLAKRGHRVTTLVTNPDSQTTIEHPQPNLTVIKAGRWFQAASTPVSGAMFRIARQQQPDVIHLHFPYPPGDMAALLVANRAPLVITYHSDIVRQRRLLQIYRPLLELTLRRASTLIATSPAYIQSSPFLRRFADKCQVVPSGIDMQRFHHATRTATSDHQPTVLFVGRLRYYKGLHILLDAMPQIQGRLLIAGNGPERERLMNQAQQRGVADRVQFLGDVPDEELPGLYQQADLFVLPAHLRSEAFGLVMVEALASGLPCVSTELGTGTSYVNKHQETGLVVPPENPTALAAAINLLLSQTALRQQYGAAGRQRAVALFDIERVIDGVERVYHGTKSPSI